jgi:hypothetical protein
VLKGQAAKLKVSAIPITNQPEEGTEGTTTKKETITELRLVLQKQTDSTRGWLQTRISVRRPLQLRASGCSPKQNTRHQTVPRVRTLHAIPPCAVLRYPNTSRPQDRAHPQTYCRVAQLVQIDLKVCDTKSKRGNKYIIVGTIAKQLPHPHFHSLEGTDYR